LSLEWLLVGLTFGSNLWRPDRVFAIAMWFAGVLFPGYVGWALTKSFKAQSLATTTLLALIAWGFATFWFCEIYVLKWRW